MQVILGFGGAVGQPLAYALATYTDQVRLCSRSPHAVPTDSAGTRYTHFPTDLLDPQQVLRAVEGCEVAYLCAGLTYELAVWQRDWPTLMSNVIEACAKTGCRLVFLDNIYAYAKTGYGDLHEEVPLEPPSAKGIVRKQVREALMAADREGRIKATIGVSADFYGPGIAHSILAEVVILKLAAGDGAQWLINADLPHSFTYTPDAGLALARLGNERSAYGQVWHLPTDSAKWTARNFVEHLAPGFGVKPRVAVLPQWLFWLIGRFNPMLREVYDTRDQLKLPYCFNSNKFERAFGMTPTPYALGLKACVAGYAKLA